KQVPDRVHAVVRHEQRELATISFVQGFLFLFFAKKENRRKLYNERIAGEQHRESGRKSFCPHLFSTELEYSIALLSFLILQAL
ncbi:MAG: hypothetical protein IKV23_05205, partial [Bacteroidaceae bacterium]|nr:hypothetical protein [Bacteroidaceae bacterium]